MTTELQTDAPENKSSVEMIDIGNRLKSERIELGFDERRIANELKITIEQVRALEANNFAYFRSVTFSRGFLKSYCRLLELDASEIIDAFDNAQMAVEPTIKPVDKVNRQTHLGDPIIIVISIVIVSVLIFLAFWWPATSSNDVVSIAKNEVTDVAPTEDASVQDSPQEADEVPSLEASKGVAATDDVSSTQPEAEPTIPVAPKTQAATNSGVVTGLTAETKAILEDAGVSPDAVVLATQKAERKQTTIAQEPAYDHDIVIVFDADCWTEVRDSTDKILYSGVKSAGTNLELTGVAPYRVVLGFAKGVSSLQYKGEAFDFSSFTRKDLARFELK